MNQWSSRRKKLIFFLILLVLVILVGIPTFFLFYEAPSCTDGKQNGDENGVDCGGSCQLICSPESLPLLMKGDPRVLEIAPNTYELVAIIENPNVAGEVLGGGYTFRLYDATSTVPIKIISGTTYIPKATTFGLFEGPFNSEIRPVRATFEWNESSLIWRKNVWLVPELKVKEVELTSASTSPRIKANLENSSLDDVSNIELVVIVTGESGNTIAASKTIVDKLTKGAVAPLVFTWPNAFRETVRSVEILPRIFPDRSLLR